MGKPGKYTSQKQKLKSKAERSAQVKQGERRKKNYERDTLYSGRRACRQRNLGVHLRNHNSNNQAEEEKEK